MVTEDGGNNRKVHVDPTEDPSLQQSRLEVSGSAKGTRPLCLRKAPDTIKTRTRGREKSRSPMGPVDVDEIERPG